MRNPVLQALQEGKDVRVKEIDVGDRRAEAKAGCPFRSVLAAVFVFYVAAALLNGEALHDKASKRAYGPVRQVWMAMTAPLNWATTTLKLDRFRAAVETLKKDE